MEELQSLEELFPDIAEELENRHSSHFGDLKRRFSKTYADFEPQYFVSAKGFANLAEVTGTTLAVSMALENGAVMALSPTNPHRDVYINTSEQDDEIVLNFKGEIVDGSSALAQLISEAYQLAIDSALVGQLMGGIIYFDMTIQPNAKGYKESIRMAFALAALTINAMLKEETLQELEQRLFGSTHPVPYHLYSNLGLVYGNHDSRCQSLKLGSSNFTFLVCEVEGEGEQTAQARQDMDDELAVLEAVALSFWNSKFPQEEPPAGKMRHLVGLLENSSVNALKDLIKEGCYTVTDYEKMLSIAIHPDKPIDRSKLLNLARRLNTFLEQYQALILLIKEPTRDRLRWTLKSSQRLLESHNLITPRSSKLLKMCEESGALACTLIQSRYLLLLCEKNKMLYLFDGLKKELFWKIASQSEETLENGASTIRRKVFSTLPSLGCGVLNPAQEMWYM